MRERVYEWRRTGDGHLARYSILRRELCEPHIYGDEFFSLARCLSIYQRTVETRPVGKVLVGHNSPLLPEGYRLGSLRNYQCSRAGRIYGDLTDLEPEVFARIARGHLDQSSIEFSPDLERIDAVSLLGSNDQFFPFPLIRVDLTEDDWAQLRADIDAAVLTIRSKPKMERKTLPEKSKRSDMSIDDKLSAIMDHLSEQATITDELAGRLEAIERRVNAREDGFEDDEEVDEEDAERSDEEVDEEDAERSDEEEASRWRRPGRRQHRRRQHRRRLTTYDRRLRELERREVERTWRRQLDTLRLERVVSDDHADAIVRAVVAEPDAAKRQGLFDALTAGLPSAPPQLDDDEATTPAGEDRESSPALRHLYQAVPPSYRQSFRQLRRDWREFGGEDGTGVNEYTFVRANLDAFLTSAQRQALPLDYTAVEPDVEGQISRAEEAGLLTPQLRKEILAGLQGRRR